MLQRSYSCAVKLITVNGRRIRNYESKNGVARYRERYLNCSITRLERERTDWSGSPARASKTIDRSRDLKGREESAQPTETRHPIKISNLLAVTVARQEQINLGNLRDGRRTAGQFRVRVRTREGCFRTYIDLSRFESMRESERERDERRAEFRVEAYRWSIT